MFFKKKSITFDKAAKFNYELDTNEKLKETLCNLSLSRNKMKKEEYLSELLGLFRKEGLDITPKELDMLLLLRSKRLQEGWQKRLLLENALSAMAAFALSWEIICFTAKTLRKF